MQLNFVTQGLSEIVQWLPPLKKEPSPLDFEDTRNCVTCNMEVTTALWSIPEMTFVRTGRVYTKAGKWMSLRSPLPTIPILGRHD